MNLALQAGIFTCTGRRMWLAALLLVSALPGTAAGARGASGNDDAKPRIAHVFFAQNHVQTPDSPYFKLVGNLEALVKVHVDGKRGARAPEVSVKLVLDAKVLDLKLKGPRRLPGPVPGDPVKIRHSYEDSFTSLIPREWIAPGLQVVIELRDRKTSGSSLKLGALLDRKIYDKLKVGAPTKLIMTMFDFHFFGDDKGKDYPEGWFEELGSKLPVAELELRRVRKIYLDKLVMIPRGEKPATLCGSMDEYERKAGIKFDGEQAMAGRWNEALKAAAGGGWGGIRRLYYSNIYGVPSGGQGGGLSGRGNGNRPGILIHELGHSFGLPHWGGKKQYPYIGDMNGISSPGGSNFPHVGPVWAFDLRKREFISCTKDGKYRKDPMQGGGAGDGKPYIFRHFSDYSVSRIRSTLERTQVVWDERNGCYMQWDQETGSYSTTARGRGPPNVPLEHDIEVISVLASASLVTREANIVYAPLGPYTATRIELFNASDPRSRSRARGGGYDDSNCNICLRVTQGSKVTAYLIKDGLDPNDDPRKADSLAVFAISLPARDGDVTQVDLLHTPGVTNRGIEKTSTVLYSWRATSRGPETETVTAIYPRRP